ncbi:MAG: low molecular weight phosphotyrosine protein phosphatase [Thermoleophilia bacterium]|nr:low molecular weight phosphotyrosine protein phosphatase [Thermoleophilia bacterium]
MHEVRVLMVCMGNICRSPMAEAVLRHRLEQEGLGDRVLVDSAGTHSYHLGHAPHPETQAELRRQGVAVGDQTSRLVTSADLDEFDFVVAMDRANLSELRTIAQQAGGLDEVAAEVALLLEYADEVPGDNVDEVPDPYYVGGYDRVYELVDAGCSGLLARVRERLES